MLTPLEPASCGDDIPEVVAANAHGTLVGAYVSAAAATAASAEVAPLLGEISSTYMVAGTMQRYTGPVIWETTWTLGPGDFYAITMMTYADEAAMMDEMDANVLELGSVPGLNSVKAVKVAEATTAANEITCSATTPDAATCGGTADDGTTTPDCSALAADTTCTAATGCTLTAAGANCPTGCTYAAAVHASCGGTADDGTTDCSALATTGTTCADATGCVLTDLEPASCGADIPEVVAANAHGTLVGAYVSAAAATAASAEVAPLLGEISSTYMVAGTMQRYTGPVIWETTWTLGPGDFYAITMMTYADEAAMMDEMDANVLELGSVPGLNSVKAVKVAEATTAANEITCSATTPDAATCGGTADDGTTTPDCSALAADTTCTAATGCTLTAAGANCPTGCTYAAAVPASCGGTADDGTTDCSALATTGTTCADATGCVLTDLVPASCGDDIPEVIESDGTVILVAAYEDAAAAVAASATISEMLGSLSLHAAPSTAPNRMTGSVIWEQPGEEEAFPPLCAAPDYARPVPPEDAESTKVSSAAGVTVASGVLMGAVSLALF